MKQRLPVLLLALAAVLMLGGCATEAYRYNTTTDGGGYYSGESVYGNADTVVYGNTWASPWAGWYGPGWGCCGIGIGATYVFHPHRHWHHRRHGNHRWHGGHGHRHWRHGRHHDHSHHGSRGHSEHARHSHR